MSDPDSSIGPAAEEVIREAIRRLQRASGYESDSEPLSVDDQLDVFDDLTKVQKMLEELLPDRPADSES